MNCNIFEKGFYPIELETCDVTDVHQVLGGPSLIHIKGCKKEALFLSILLHGNETTSFFALQKILLKIKEEKPNRDLIIFIGNTFAAEQGMRHLPNQVDYNRIWEDGSSKENMVIAEVVEYAKTHGLFASIDIHNNTGKNPYYSCINSLEPEYLNLAKLFGLHTVYFTEPHNVQSMCFSKFTISVTIEAGLPGLGEGIDAVTDFVLTVVNTDSLAAEDIAKKHNVFHTIARIMIDKDAKIDFLDSSSSKNDFSFIGDLDDKNFEVVHSHSHLGWARDLKMIRVEANNGSDCTEDFFEIIDGELKTKRVFMPSMFTKDIYVMKEDCLGYLMEIMVSV